MPCLVVLGAGVRHVSQWAHLEALAGLFLPEGSRDHFLAFSGFSRLPAPLAQSPLFFAQPWLVGSFLYHITRTLTSWFPLQL